MFNKAILIGRMTADPELKQTQSGIFICNFRIAVDRRFSRDAERKADFITIVAWRERAEFVSKYFHKGDPIGVEGSIQTREYDDKTGTRRYAVEVVADNLFFVGGKGSGSGSGSGSGARTQESASVAYASGAAGDFEEIETDNDLPF